ncbi:hypothetical protein ACH34W_47580 [Actinomadura sp. 6N118]
MRGSDGSPAEPGLPAATPSPAALVEPRLIYPSTETADREAPIPVTRCVAVVGTGKPSLATPSSRVCMQ